jgi:hypothetical protein
MRRKLIFSLLGAFLIAAWIVLSACQAAVETVPGSTDTSSSDPASTSSETVVIPTGSGETTEQPTETTPVSTPTPSPKPVVDRSAEYIYQAFPKFTPVNYDSPAILPETEDMGQGYIDKISFICDSPTYWLWPKGLLSGGKESNQVWTGPEGTMTLAYQSTYWILDPFDNEEKPIRSVVEQHKPEYLIIALGINGVSFMKEDYFVDEYTDLVTDIQAISPDTIILLQSIYPITSDYRNWGHITNVSITRANSWILKIAEKTGCKYLDTISVLLDDNGEAKAELMRSDGLHPNTDGLKLILHYIRTHGYRVAQCQSFKCQEHQTPDNAAIQ